LRALFGLAVIVGSVPASAAWEYNEIKDDVDGTTAYVLETKSSVTVQGADRKPHQPFLQLRCDEQGGRPYWRVHWFAIIETMVSGNSSRSDVQAVRVQARIDGKLPADRGAWTMVRDESLEGMTTDSVSAIVKTLLDAKELRLHVGAGYGKAYDATFDVSGLEAALEQLQPHCKRL
jgi:hypothetical protein